MRRLRRLWLALSLPLAVACAGVPVSPEVAAIADPLLRVVGFCRDNGADVSSVVEQYRSGDQLNAALQTAALLHRLSAEQGVEIPPEIDASYRAAMGVILDGMQEGLRALDGRDAQGRKVEP